MTGLSPGVIFAIAVLLGVSATGRASAQGAPPPNDMQAGGLAPPSPLSGPAPPQPAAPTPTQMRLQEASAEDSGRGLEFVYFDVEGGVEHVSLESLHASGALVDPTVRTSDVGSLLGVAIGARLLYLTVGPRLRFGHFHDWSLWSVGLDLGWRIPLGNLEPYAALGAGYSRLTGSADAPLGSGNGVSVKGFHVRLGAGVDYYVTSVFSVGGQVTAELLGLSRSAVAQPGPLGADASALGLGFAATAVAGLHF